MENETFAQKDIKLLFPYYFKKPGISKASKGVIIKLKRPATSCYEMVTKYSAIFFANCDEYFINLYNNSDQTQFFQYNNVCQSEVKKQGLHTWFYTSPLGVGIWQ